MILPTLLKASNFFLLSAFTIYSIAEGGESSRWDSEYGLWGRDPFDGYDGWEKGIWGEYDGWDGHRRKSWDGIGTWGAYGIGGWYGNFGDAEFHGWDRNKRRKYRRSKKTRKYPRRRFGHKGAFRFPLIGGHGDGLFGPRDVDDFDFRNNNFIIVSDEDDHKKNEHKDPSNWDNSSSQWSQSNKNEKKSDQWDQQNKKDKWSDSRWSDSRWSDSRWSDSRWSDGRWR